jgi:Uma2 family endonuclease
VIGPHETSIHEVVLPQRRVSAPYDRALIQRLLGSALGTWADAGAHGRVGIGWRFRVEPSGDVARLLAPDIAFLSYDDLPEHASREAVQVPLAAPTVAVEILTPSDSRLDVNDKIAAYLGGGGEAVILVDPVAHVVEVHDGFIAVLGAGDTLVHAALPGFALDLGALFARL